MDKTNMNLERIADCIESQQSLLVKQNSCLTDILHELQTLNNHETFEKLRDFASKLQKRTNVCCTSKGKKSPKK